MSRSGIGPFDGCYCRLAPGGVERLIDGALALLKEPLVNLLSDIGVHQAVAATGKGVLGPKRVIDSVGVVGSEGASLSDDGMIEILAGLGAQDRVECASYLLPEPVPCVDRTEAVDDFG